MTGTMFVSMKQYFGENIECLSNKNDLSKEMIQLCKFQELFDNLAIIVIINY